MPKRSTVYIGSFTKLRAADSMMAAASKDMEGLSVDFNNLKVVERTVLPTNKLSEPMDADNLATEQTHLSPLQSDTSTKTPTVIIILGMAGSGKTTLTGKLISYLHCKGSAPYVMNLDPACLDPPYGVNIDIRDTIDYKQVMRSHKLGPNGAIVTSINLFSTKFDAVLELLKKRTSSSPYIIVDTPGQLEVFMWSASGSIMTEILAANFPTIMLYVTDLSVTKTPISFISNMTYSCSVLYKSKLPLVLALNKCDLQGAQEVVRWITDFTAFQSELNKYEGQTVNLASSLSLVLDDFYSIIKHQPVSALNGEGVENLFALIDESVVEYELNFKANYDKLVKERSEKRMAPAPKKVQRTKPANDAFAFSEPGTDATALGFSLTLDSSSEGGDSEEEDPRDLDDDELGETFGAGTETIRQVYQKEADRKLKKAEKAERS